MSWALSSFLIWPPVQSMHSTRNSAPGFTHETMGTSGCHRLWMTSCFVGAVDRSTLMSVSMDWFSSIPLDRKQTLERRLVDPGPRALVDERAPVEHEDPVGHR